MQDRKVRSTFVGTYVGLKAVPFSPPLDTFMREHKERSAQYGGVQVTHTTMNVADALLALTQGNLYMHHLSCAANTGFHEDAALCIHYTIQDVRHAVAIPGVNYIPDEKTLQQLQKLYERISR